MAKTSKTDEAKAVAPTKKASTSPATIDAGTGEVLPSKLSKEDAEELERCKKAIKKGWDTFLEVGRALAIIRDKSLYKAKHSQFEEYCRVEWGFSKTHVNRQIAASHVVDVLTPIGVIIENESVARPMTGLTDDQIKETYEAAKKLAEEKKKDITAAIVTKAAVKFKPAKRGKRSKSKAEKAAEVDLRPALKLLASAEKLAEENKDKAILKKLTELRELLVELGGK
jgi:CRISPR/Cas system CSM-associated protein Csm2 small subunit